MKHNLIFALLLGWVNLCNAQDIYSYKSSMDFANHLYRTYEFDLAAKEYARLFSINKKDSLVNYRLLNSFYQQRKFNEVVGFGSKIPAEFLCGSLPTGKLYLKSELLSGYTDAGQNTISMLPLSNEEEKYYKLSAYLLSGNWDKALAYKAANPEVHSLSMHKNVFEDLQNTKFKNKYAALALSTAIPGLGKIYSGYWKDGLFSLLMITVSAWQSYRGFDKKGVESAYGWVYAGLGTGFYLGNLYGTVKAVNKRNKKLNHDLFHKVEHNFEHNTAY
jgi:hypothetical protein